MAAWYVDGERPLPSQELPQFRGLHLYSQFLVLGVVSGSTGSVTAVLDINLQ